MTPTSSTESLPHPSPLAQAAVPGSASAAHPRVRATALSLLAIVAVGAGLRFALIGQHSLWADEAFVAWAVRFEWKDLFPVLATADSHPPLYYAVMKAWVSLAGTGEAALRVPSAVFSSLSVVLTYALARRISSEAVALLSALLVAVSPFDIMAAQEARMYPLLSVLAVTSTLALAASVEHGSARRWGAYVLLATPMVYTHYLGFLVLLAHGMWVAVCARKAIVPWLAGILAVGILFAPWCAALATRVTDVAQLGRSATSIVPYLTPDTLLALFAFGGSLFGTATYFGPGTSGVIERTVVLLPFAVVVWRGVTALWPQRNALGLIGLPVVVPVGVAALLVLSKPVVWPRAFSFLVPFYAMFLALGVVDIAHRAGRHRDRALVLLVAGLLAYSVPVLRQHYFDPSARPYQWRAAAGWVAGEVRTGDIFLFVGRASADSFTYYFRQPYPSLTLRLRRDPRPTFTPATARDFARRYPRLWVVMSPPFGPAHPVVRRQLLPAIDSGFQLVGVRDFNQAWVYLLVSRTTTHR